MHEAFEKDPDLIYLNAANQSLCPRRVRLAIARYHETYERNPSAGLSSAWGGLWELQAGLAHFLGARPEDLFLRTNVTSVLNIFLLGMPLPSDSEILVGEMEYGAIVNICRVRAEREGLGLRVLQMPATLASLRALTRQSLIDSIVSQLGPRTRLVLLSHVLGGTGLVLPIEEIAAEARRRGIFLVVDGAYAPGAIAVDFSRLADVDAYGCSLYKWMLGPKGTAFGWVSPRLQEVLDPLAAGWTTFGTFGPFSSFGGGNRFQERFLMAGCHDFAPFYAIRETLEYWETEGARRVRARMGELREKLDSAIARLLGWKKLAPGDLSLSGPFCTYLLPEALQPAGPRAVCELLEKERLQINTIQLRGRWALALSPHVHNTDSEIEDAARRLAHWACEIS